jgi:hypothetical protein
LRAATVQHAHHKMQGFHIVASLMALSSFPLGSAAVSHANPLLRLTNGPSSSSPAPRALVSAPSPTAFATTISTSRFWIDHFNLTYSLTSDEPLVSVGASDDYGDGLGSLKATAVCFKTGANINNTSPFLPTAVHFLLYKTPLQERTDITDFSLTLFSDDGTTSHNPYQQVGARSSTRLYSLFVFAWDRFTVVCQPFVSAHLQLSPPIALTGQSTPLVSTRSVWFAQSVSWPLLLQNTYYWVALSPTAALSISAASQPLETTGPRFQGAVWAGFNTTIDSAPPVAANDPVMFTARLLRSQTGAGDAANAANTAAAINFISGATTNTAGWATYGGARLHNWEAAGSNILYGVQVLGYLMLPTTTTTASCQLS